MRLCSEPGCGRAIPDLDRYCAECGRNVVKQHGNADRDMYAALYKGREWQATSRRVMHRDPVCTCIGCVACTRRGSALVVCRSLTALVDHIVPAGIAIVECAASKLWPYNRFAGFYLTCNLHGLCRGCHGVKTAADKQRRRWPSVVEAWSAKRQVLLSD